MSDLEEIRKRKLAELQAAQSQEQSQEQAAQQQLAELESVVKKHFTKEALARFGNIKAAYSERAMQLTVVLGQLIQQGQGKKINDELLKQILKKITPEQKQFTIKK